MNEKVRKEIEELIKNGFPGTSGAGAEGQKPPLSDNNPAGITPFVLEIKNLDVIASIAQSLIEMKKLNLLLLKENLPPNIIASILFSLIMTTKPCVLMNFYETTETYLDHYFHILPCVHLFGEVCENGHQVGKCQDLENPCADRAVKYGEWSTWLNCDVCPFKKYEEAQK